MIYELRRYTLRPGTRDTLIELFEREFVDTQEEAGIEVLAQFRDPRAPDTFTWIRAFPDMEARFRSLTDFYTGAAWKAHAEAARATMVDTDDVLLLRPVLVPPFGEVPRAGATGVTEGSGGASPYQVTVFPVAEGSAARFAELAAGAAACFETEHAVNTYAPLPVREGENVFVRFTRGEDAPAEAALDDHLTGPPQHFLLHPTERSRVR
ncbi:NIPSNAP family protein [Nonomuraea endophytica]|uniref:Quinol monooxygenase YgiN n=1 Tax=Nonomuraea endophytica TaxID=714136 RepID=A0A7W8A7K1_9ACTN|nr:NIPSNAP family protein [Nonomuraea endophytica]MBB5080524.1 quinol monooxygenase YgiN [Nonomuraea endophytica]